MKRRSFHALVSAALTMAVMAVPACPQPGFAARRAAAEAVGATAGFVELVDRVKPAVVNISTSRTVRTPGNPFQHFFGPFRGSPFGDIPDRERKQRSLGSGFIIDAAGHIITNNHVVAGAEEIRVKLADGRELPVQVVGRDSKTDIALLKMAAAVKDLQTLPLGDSDDVKVGEWVIAIGNPFGLALTVTQGIVSATGRVIGAGPYDDFIQTDAAINPGNSGGPLINLRGEVIGINTAIVAAGQGIGFAVPSNMARAVVAQLMQKGKVVRGWIGVSTQTVTPDLAPSFGLKEPKGALVSEVATGSPAAAAGMKRGDVVIAFNGKEVKSVLDLPKSVAETPIGKVVPVRVIRDKKEMTLRVKVEELKEPAQQPSRRRPRS
ncbi:MAG TPA: Do family serine endopeptidase [Syntrophales bacterium]|nr:Do family serine endopeptidase [Syntrophales bacterium]HOX94810.1 Do family serine endopeptidase [Syntrophales bacterium]HPI57903.1 Do family serine endopeptidase [Syntrophales bacterium]HPN24561.1 Do family serine endopeptidase [Syntrophales bacterium]HQM28867.1 Do family serine endopeptidase [Syntrophales bacterium]